MCVCSLTFLGFRVFRALHLCGFAHFSVCVRLCVFSLFFLGLGLDELCVVCSFCHLSVTLTPLLNVVVSNQAF
jgi:hypothetical protein